MKKTKYFLASFAVLAALIWGAVFSYPDKNLHLVFCDVGQGDAILAIRGESQLLIDAGPGEKVLGCLSRHLPFWDKTLELVVLTHPEADHLGGLISVIERYNVRQLISHSLVTETGVFAKFRQEVVEKKIPVYSPKAGDKIKISGILLEVLYPQEKMGEEEVWKSTDETQVLGVQTYSGNLNDISIVTKLSYGDFDALLTGDIGFDQEREIMNDLDIKPVEVLKVAHHGSKYSTGEEFLRKLSPDLAVISVGVTNRYGHPASEVIKRLTEQVIKFLRTDIEGEIEIVSDGKSWRVVD